MTKEQLRALALRVITEGIGPNDWPQLVTRGYVVNVFHEGEAEPFAVYECMDPHQGKALALALDQAAAEHGEKRRFAVQLGKRLLLSSPDLCELEREVDHLASRLIKFATYVAHRGGAGTSDAGHDEALDQAQVKYGRARKFLGYNIG